MPSHCHSAYLYLLLIMPSFKLQYSYAQLNYVLSHSQVASIRQHLATIYEKEGDWRNAAQVLVGIPLETGQK